MARGMGPPTVRRPPMAPRPPKVVDPRKATFAPPRLKPIATRDYGKGGTPLSGAPDMGVRGAGIGYGGPKLFGS
jgi:hypothetical protein